MGSTPSSLQGLLRRGFSLIELLMALAILSLLAALLFPVVLEARHRAYQTVCLSNLHQVGMATSLYQQDYDGYYPYAVDPADKYEPGLWSFWPSFNAELPFRPLLQDVLQPHVRQRQVFHCPADTGFKLDESSGRYIDPFGHPPFALPSSYAKFGTSYYYQTALGALHLTDSSLMSPSGTSLLFDGSGRWHGDVFRFWPRYNVLFCDEHVKNLTYAEWGDTFLLHPGIAFSGGSP